ncbi:phosphomannomutase/phosphoglucomutase [Patescibacteria group bacterium]|nr:phosphomannomutase/phosphoglucomutase [Patescibacteria group bacterium]
MINSNIFKAYDIRGVYPDEINEQTAYKIGVALATFLSLQFKVHSSKLTIVIGQDCRLSSPQLFKSFSQGVLDQGANVINLGLVATDVLYFAISHFNCDGGVMITASHNPWQYNGFKMLARGPKFIFQDWGLPQIRKLVEQENVLKTKGKQGKIIKKNIIPSYLKYILNLVDLKQIKPMKVVVDAGNGMGGKVIQELAKKIPIKLYPLYFDPDGYFPNHSPNPRIKENIKDLQMEVIRRQANFGLAFDGDADRSIFVNEKGETIDQGMIIILFAQDYLKKHPKEKIIYSSTCSKIVPEMIKKSRGVPIKAKTGRPFIRKMALKNNVIFGGETSGHLFFRDVFYNECGGLSLLLMLKILSQKNKPLSRLIKKFKKYTQLNVNLTVKDRQKAIKKLAESYQKGQQDHLDGLTVEFPDWWFNARLSNTEPLLRLTVEAKDKEQAIKRKIEISKIIKGL